MSSYVVEYAEALCSNVVGSRASILHESTQNKGLKTHAYSTTMSGKCIQNDLIKSKLASASFQRLFSQVSIWFPTLPPAYVQRAFMRVSYDDIPIPKPSARKGIMPLSTLPYREVACAQSAP